MIKTLSKIFVCIIFSVALCYGNTYELNEEGFISDWLVIGPYPSYMGDLGPKGYEDDLLINLGGEANIEPYLGMKDKAVFIADKSKLIAGIGSTNEWGFKETKEIDVEWKELHWPYAKKVQGRSNPIVSLDGTFGEFKDNIVAYMVCYVISPDEREVSIRLGSDDDYKLYVNHNYLGGISVSRGSAPDSNIHLVRLNKGANTLLLKVVDRTGGHTFCLAITDKEGKKYNDIKVTLEDPKRTYEKTCKNIEKVNVIDEKFFGMFRLDGGEPYISGKNTLEIGLGYAEVIDGEIGIKVYDKNKNVIWSKDEVVKLSPEKAIIYKNDIQISDEIFVETIIKKNSVVLGKLNKEVRAISPESIEQMLKDKITQKNGLIIKRNELKDNVNVKMPAELKSLREEIKKQHTEIESIYEVNSKFLVKKYGKKGLSIDKPFIPIDNKRISLCLNGDKWEFAEGTRDATKKKLDRERIPDDEWKQTKIPNLESWGGWYRLKFDLPEELKQKRIILRLDNAITYVKVYLNTEVIGEETSSIGISKLDLKNIKPKDNTLIVYVEPGRNQEFFLGRSQYQSVVEGVFLEAEPEISVQDTFVITSVQESKIEAKTQVKNNTNTNKKIKIKQYCVKDGKIRKDIGEKIIDIKAEEIIETDLSNYWTDPKLWGIGGKYGNPDLYYLVTDIIDGNKVIDRHFTRFGFREIWIEGFHFYLNGKRIFIQGDTGVGAVDLRRRISIQLPLLREGNINTIRMHDTEYYTTVLPQLCDEIGMLVCAQMYPILPGKDNKIKYEEYVTDNTPAHKKNIENYTRWVKMMRNHPSVAIYSTDNEIFTQAWDTPAQLDYNVRNDKIGAYYEKYVESIDPTRIMTRDGDEGTWGHSGKWQEAPPCDTANYHYPDFNPDNVVVNWETLYDGRPVIFGETLYWSYGAWDDWIGPIPSQVNMKTERCRKILTLYRDLEVSGIIPMGLSADGFIYLDEKEGIGPWKITQKFWEETFVKPYNLMWRDNPKRTLKHWQVIEKIWEDRNNNKPLQFPDFPSMKVNWPSLSGVGYKPEAVAIGTEGNHVDKTPVNAGNHAINWFDNKVPTHVTNSVNAIYKEVLHPMPALKDKLPPELLIQVEKNGVPVPYANVFIEPMDKQAITPVGIMADSKGTAWFLLQEAGKYSIKVGNTEKIVDAKEVSNFPLKAGFDYLQHVKIELGK